jgi:hypothetical protein
MDLSGVDDKQSRMMNEYKMIHPQEAKQTKMDPCVFESNLFTHYTPCLDRARCFQDGLVMPVSAQMIRQWNKFVSCPRLNPSLLFDCNRLPIEAIVCKSRETRETSWSRGSLFHHALPYAYHFNDSFATIQSLMTQSLSKSSCSFSRSDLVRSI